MIKIAKKKSSILTTPAAQDRYFNNAKFIETTMIQVEKKIAGAKNTAIFDLIKKRFKFLKDKKLLSKLQAELKAAQKSVNKAASTATKLRARL